MGERQARWRQFFTSQDVVDLVLGFCLRQPGEHLLDPSCGEGIFLNRAAKYKRWLAQAMTLPKAVTLWGVEIDVLAADIAKRSLESQSVQSTILVRDFFTLTPGGGLPDSVDCIVGNPPYTRSESLVTLWGASGAKRDHQRNAMTGQDGVQVAELGKRGS